MLRKNRCIRTVLPGGILTTLASIPDCPLASDSAVLGSHKKLGQFGSFVHPSSHLPPSSSSTSSSSPLHFIILHPSSSPAQEYISIAWFPKAQVLHSTSVVFYPS
ncbi:hypothetical protein TWF594_002832 [Orbilia oligospora]|nr:hypothetical protein TWF594_002832 [Orbilia oligospora]